MITLIGMGSGTPGSLTAQGLAALQGADRILGAKRLLATLPEGCTGNRQALYKPDEILACLAAHPDEKNCAGVQRRYRSGASLLRRIPAAARPTMLRAFLAWTLVSGAARPGVQPATPAIKPYSFSPARRGPDSGPRLPRPGVRRRAFSPAGPTPLCGLTAAGLGDAHALVGENLGTPDEKIHFGTAQELAGQAFASLSVLLVEHAVHPERRTPGLPDEAFIRGEVPMTKQEVRAAALAKLAVRPADTLWDVGAGTGSVSVELALAAPQAHVYAVECEPDACALIRRNREKFAAWNLSLIEGRAPAALEALPAPDAVFIGGTKGSMAAVVDTVLAKNANARICIAAIALESLSAAIAALTAHGLSAEVTQLAVSRTRPAGRLHLLTANNPIFLITGERK